MSTTQTGYVIAVGNPDTAGWTTEGRDGAPTSG